MKEERKSSEEHDLAFAKLSAVIISVHSEQETLKSVC